MASGVLERNHVTVPRQRRRPSDDVVTGSGYTASGTLARGNVRIHRR